MPSIDLPKPAVVVRGHLLAEGGVHVGGDHMVGEHATEFIEQERRYRGERAAVVGDGLTEHHVERAEPVGRDEQQEAIASVVDVADLAAEDALEVSHGMGSGWWAASSGA